MKSRYLEYWGLYNVEGMVLATRRSQQWGVEDSNL